MSITPAGPTLLPPIDRIEATVRALLTHLQPAPKIGSRGRGPPPIRSATVLGTALLVGILHGAASQIARWRRITQVGLWDHPRIPVSDEAIRQRLLYDGPTVPARLFADATAELLATTAPLMTLAPFATDVVAIDESTLDPVARLLPRLRGVPRGMPSYCPAGLPACSTFGVSPGARSSCGRTPCRTRRSPLLS